MNFGIIAAGEGARLVAEGVEYPKPLVRLGGVPLIERLIRIFIEKGASTIAVIVNERMTEVKEFLDSLSGRIPAQLKIVVKTTPSSMHSFYEIGKSLRGKGRFIVTTVDTVFHESDFSKYVDAYEEQPDTIDGMMALTTYIDDEKPLFVETDRNLDILAFLDSSVADADDASGNKEFVSGGIYGLSDKAIDVLDDCLRKGMSRMRNYQRALVAAGLNLKGYDMGKIIDVDHAEDIRKAETFISESD